MNIEQIISQVTMKLFKIQNNMIYKSGMDEMEREICEISSLLNSAERFKQGLNISECLSIESSLNPLRIIFEKILTKGRYDEK